MDFAREREIERENNVQRYKRQEDQEKARDSAKQDRHAGFIQSVFLLLKTEFLTLLHPVVLLVANFWITMEKLMVNVNWHRSGNQKYLNSAPAYMQMGTFSIKKLFG